MAPHLHLGSFVSALLRFRSSSWFARGKSMLLRVQYFTILPLGRPNLRESSALFFGSMTRPVIFEPGDRKFLEGLDVERNLLISQIYV